MFGLHLIKVFAYVHIFLLFNPINRNNGLHNCIIWIQGQTVHPQSLIYDVTFNLKSTQRSLHYRSLIKWACYAMLWRCPRYLNAHNTGSLTRNWRWGPGKNLRSGSLGTLKLP